MNPIPIGQPITPIMPGIQQPPLGYIPGTMPKISKQPPCTIPNRTVYANNLNEKIRIEALKKALEAIFKIYGKIVEIRANASLNRKGQAYITFENIDDAERAVKEANGFVLFGKPMMVQFARYDSYVSAVSDGKDLDEYKSHLKIEKEKREKLMRQVESKPGLGIAGIPGIIPQPMGVPGPYNYAGVGGPVLTANLPNKILFLQQIPSQVNKQELEHTFRSMYGFVEVRTVPGKSSIAFVEFEDEGSAIEAKNVLGNEWNLKEGQPPVLITFAKR